MTDTTALTDLLRAHSRGAVATLRADGRPQLSTVDYAVDDAATVVRFSTTDGRAKVANLRRDPRASFYVSSADGSSYAVFDARAELSDVATAPDDAAVEELIDLYRAVQGEHPDWQDYREAMVRDRRLVVRLRLDRPYGRP